LREQFEQLTAGEINRLIREGKEENVQLEFKTVNADLDRDDRRVFAKCVSGFANSSGGIGPISWW
jgi:predicted HTH transcriptional regulator